MHRCLVAVKVKDKSPTVLLKMIIRNKEINRRIFNFLFFRRVVNSVFIASMIILKNESEGEGRSQNCWTRIKGKMDRLSQLSGRKKDDEGSKIENNLFIIFSLERGKLLNFWIVFVILMNKRNELRFS